MKNNKKTLIEAHMLGGSIGIYKKIKKLKIRPEGGEKVNSPIGWRIRESIQEN